jgi:hypothetical protein
MHPSIDAAAKPWTGTAKVRSHIKVIRSARDMSKV